MNFPTAASTASNKNFCVSHNSRWGDFEESPALPTDIYTAAIPQPACPAPPTLSKMLMAFQGGQIEEKLTTTTSSSPKARSTDNNHTQANKKMGTDHNYRHLLKANPNFYDYTSAPHLALQT